MGCGALTGIDRRVQGLRSMYTIAKGVAREKLRLCGALVAPMQRLWRVATSVEGASAGHGKATTHEVVPARRPGGDSRTYTHTHPCACVRPCLGGVLDTADAPVAGHLYHAVVVREVLCARVPVLSSPDEQGDRNAAV